MSGFYRREGEGFYLGGSAESEFNLSANWPANFSAGPSQSFAKSNRRKFLARYLYVQDQWFGDPHGRDPAATQRMAWLGGLNLLLEGHESAIISWHGHGWPSLYRAASISPDSRTSL